MRRIRLYAFVAAFLCCLCSTSWSEEPEKVGVCQLQADPSAYNHKLIEVAAFVSHGFEDFTLFDPACHDWPLVWLEYGGKSKSDTMYCCGPTAGKSRSQGLVVEDIPIPLVEDDQFRQFDKQIQPPFRSERYGSIVHATLVGRFFSGTKQQLGNGKSFWGGYGHMGCCSLFAIQQIKSVSPQDRDDLDDGASFDQPEMNKVGCGYTYLTPIEPGNSLVEDQRQADLGQRAWAFDDPARVASDGLLALAKIESPGPLALKEKRRAQGRIVYEWKQPGQQETYMVVVSRPYWLSFYSKDAKKVAWVVVAAYESTCGKKKTVTRIR
jgi:hypothetical protein